MQKWIRCARFIGCQSDFSHWIAGHGNGIPYYTIYYTIYERMCTKEIFHLQIVSHKSDKLGGNCYAFLPSPLRLPCRHPHPTLARHWLEPISFRCPNVFYSPRNLAALSFTLTSQQEVRPHPQPISQAVKTKSSGNWHMLTCGSSQVLCLHGWECVYVWVCFPFGAIRGLN